MLMDCLISPESCTTGKPRSFHLDSIQFNSIQSIRESLDGSYGEGLKNFTLRMGAAPHYLKGFFIGT